MANRLKDMFHIIQEDGKGTHYRAYAGRLTLRVTANPVNPDTWRWDSSYMDAEAGIISIATSFEIERSIDFLKSKEQAEDEAFQSISDYFSPLVAMLGAAETISPPTA